MKLHLGCGHRYIEGFTHVDIRPFDHVDYQTSVARLDAVESDSVDLIYASHVLEHFGRHEYMAALSEWYRVLRRGGILRLSVPDFEKTVEVYLREKHLNKGLQSHWGALVGGQENEFDYHRTVFDRSTLEESLRATGFTTVTPWNWRDTEHSHVDDYSQAHWPHMDKENGLLMSLNLEAVK